MPDLSDILKLVKHKSMKVFFSGIGGISMSAIAATLKQKGFEVCGSDVKESESVRKLRELGIGVFISHRSENVDNQCGLLVYNARIREDNPEIIRARELNIPVVKRTEMLGELMRSYKTSIGISGTHGKSTVTSMTSEIFMQAETDPAFFIGAVYPPVNSAYRSGSGDYIIVEACEYADSFLSFYPTVSAVLNIEMDHPDYFKDLSAVISSFEKFLSNTSETAVINADDSNAVKSAEKFGGEIITYSLKNEKADIFVKNIDYQNGFPAFDITAKGSHYAHINLLVPGEFNIYNAAAAAGIAYKCGLEGEFVEAGLNIFKGAARRFEYKGTLNGAKIYNDYAHHPTAVKQVLTEMNKIARAVNGNLWYVFQPHTYSRTHELLDDLCDALSGADKLILTEIYSATEQNVYNIHSKDIAERLNNCLFMENFGEIAEYLRSHAAVNDFILVTGAGDIENLTKLLV